MRNLKTFISIAFLLIGGASACTKNTLSLPDPAQSLEGVYQAQVDSLPFPIKGGSITLTIKSVAKDTAEVSLQTYINGQLEDSLKYRKAFIAQQINRTSLNEGCIDYIVYLSRSRETNLLTITCSEKNTIKYLYTLTGQQNDAVVLFRKI